MFVVILDVDMAWHSQILDALLDKQGVKVKGSTQNHGTAHHIFPKPTHYPSQSYPVVGQSNKPDHIDSKKLTPDEALHRLSLNESQHKSNAIENRGEESDKAKSLPGPSGYLNNNSAYWEKMLARQQKRSKGGMNSLSLISVDRDRHFSICR